MKHTFKSLLGFVLSAVILLQIPILSAYAVSGPVISLSDATAVPLDTVTLVVNMDENPGIMAMTFTVTYDNTAFTFNSYKIGIFNDYLIVDHPEYGYVSFVNCESRNRTYTGTIFTLFFTVNETAPAKDYKFSVKNINPRKYGDNLNGCFANNEGDKFEPVIKGGNVTVGSTCLNSGHTYSEWTVTTPPLCTEAGIKSRACIKCGHTETAEIEPKGHDFEKEWTIDRPAGNGAVGIMSRHCKNCDFTTDVVYFSNKDVKENDFENKTEAKVESKEFQPLAEIEKKNKKDGEKDKNVSNAVDRSEQEKQQSDTQKESTKIQLAEEIVSAKQHTSTSGIIYSLHRYLFGSGTRTGIITAGISAIKGAYKEISSNRLVRVVAIIALVAII